MDFELTDLQTELADGMRRLCEGRFDLDHLRSFESADKVVDRKDWLQLGEAGVFNLCLPESAGGVGLGLAIAMRAVGLHHGRVWAENARPGLRVLIELPLDRVARDQG